MGTEGTEQELQRLARETANEASIDAAVWTSYAKELRAKGAHTAAERVERSAQHARAEAAAFRELSR